MLGLFERGGVIHNKEKKFSSKPASLSLAVASGVNAWPSGCHSLWPEDAWGKLMGNFKIFSIFSFFHCQKKKQKRLGLAY